MFISVNRIIWGCIQRMFFQVNRYLVSIKGIAESTISVDYYYYKSSLSCLNYIQIVNVGSWIDITH